MDRHLSIVFIHSLLLSAFCQKDIAYSKPSDLKGSHSPLCLLSMFQTTQPESNAFSMFSLTRPVFSQAKWPRLTLGLGLIALIRMAPFRSSQAVYNVRTVMAGIKVGRSLFWHKTCFSKDSPIYLFIYFALLFFLFCIPLIDFIYKSTRAYRKDLGLWRRNYLF